MPSTGFLFLPWSLVSGPFSGGGGGEEEGTATLPGGPEQGYPPPPHQPGPGQVTPPPPPPTGHFTYRIQHGRYTSCIFTPEDFLDFKSKLPSFLIFFEFRPFHNTFQIYSKPHSVNTGNQIKACSLIKVKTSLGVPVERDRFLPIQCIFTKGGIKG